MKTHSEINQPETSRPTFEEHQEDSYLHDSYSCFSSLTAPYADSSPQHQGLTLEEFERALDDPEVTKTVTTYEGRAIGLPQLGPVNRNGWLNADFYAKKFPEETARGSVLNYVDLPRVVPGPDVRSRLSKLAEESGLLVFDYPLTDEDYPDRICAMLDSMNIVVGEAEQLGDQTYFAAQTRLKRKQYPLSDPKTHHEAFAEMIAEGSFNPNRFVNGASIEERISDDEATEMLRFYEEAYVVLSDSPAVQGLSPKEFSEMMTEREWVTKVIRRVGGKAVALCLLDNRLEELSWVNSDYYKTRYPEQYRKGQVMWFPGLASDPSGDVGISLMKMVNLIAEVSEKGDNDILIVFDSCDHNTGQLDKGLDYLINRTKQASVEFETIAVQRYVAFRLRPKS